MLLSEEVGEGEERVWGSRVMSSACVSLKKRMFRGREGSGTGPGEVHPTPAWSVVSCSRLGNTSITSESLAPPVASVSSVYESRVGLKRRRTEGEGTGEGRLGRAPHNGGLGDPSCFFLVASPRDEQSRAGKTVCPGPSDPMSPSQLGNRCLALRTSSSMSCVQFVLPEGEALAAELTFREDAGESCERPPPVLLLESCRGRDVGLALSEDTLE